APGTGSGAAGAAGPRAARAGPARAAVEAGDPPAAATAAATAGDREERSLVVELGGRTAATAGTGLRPFRGSAVAAGIVTVPAAPAEPVAGGTVEPLRAGVHGDGRARRDGDRPEEARPGAARSAADPERRAAAPAPAALGVERDLGDGRRDREREVGSAVG